jgi:hypothetical protein
VSASAVLERLERVKQTGPGRWIARCPAHEDRSPSLSIRELDDGQTLLHCFAGCGAIEVLDSLGLDWSALFPGGLGNVAPSHSRVPVRDLLEILDHEIIVASLILADVLGARGVDNAQWSRLAQAAARIGKAHDHVR